MAVAIQPGAIKKAEPPLLRQLGYLLRSVAFRPSLAAGLALSYLYIIDGVVKTLPLLRCCIFIKFRRNLVRHN